jgi:hypothetical protein
MAFSQGMDDWRVHEGNTHVGGGKDGDGVHDVGARWPTHQVSFASIVGLFCLYSRSRSGQHIRSLLTCISSRPHGY